MSLHDNIMNIPVDTAKLPQGVSGSGERIAYKEGHRDARHAAAELSLAWSDATDIQLELLFAAVHEHGEFGREFREHARAILGAKS